MNSSDIERMLISAVRLNQKVNGIQEPALSANTRPQSDLEKFDSLNALEVIVEIETTLNQGGTLCELDVSVFYTAKGIKELSKVGTCDCLTVREIAANIMDAISKGGK